MFGMQRTVLVSGSGCEYLHLCEIDKTEFRKKRNKALPYKYSIQSMCSRMLPSGERTKASDAVEAALADSDVRRRCSRVVAGETGVGGVCGVECYRRRFGIVPRGCGCNLWGASRGLATRPLVHKR